MRNLDIADSHATLEQYVTLNVIGSPHPMLVGANQTPSADLLGAMPAGGAAAIAARSNGLADDELRDQAAMEAGTDQANRLVSPGCHEVVKISPACRLLSIARRCGMRVMTDAHDQGLTLHLITHVPAHEPREEDPHYHLFEQVKARMKRQRLWRCAINDNYCGGNVELHHSHIEFSQAGGVDLDKINRQLGLHLDDDGDFQEWIESPGNLEPLCAVHHRTHFGVHVIPGPLWEPLRFRAADVKPSAEFVPADEVDDDGKDEKTVVKTTKTTTVRRRPTKSGEIEVDKIEDEKTKVKVVAGHHTVEEHVERTHNVDRVAVPRPRAPHKPERRGFFARMFGRD